MRKPQGAIFGPGVNKIPKILDRILFTLDEPGKGT